MGHTNIMRDQIMHHRLVITPLTPIHMGTGEDFIPTNFVIDEGVLYHFEPSQVALSDGQRKQLIDAAKSGNLLSVYRFYANKSNKQAFKCAAHTLIPVMPSIASQYQKTFATMTQVEQKVWNNWAIARAAYSPIVQQSIIPGSALKGALRTALIDKKNNGSKPKMCPNGKREESKDVEKRLVGDFEDGLMRLLKIADCHPAENLQSQNIQTQVVWCVNRKKVLTRDKNGNEVQSRGVTTRREVIVPGQYRAMTTEVVLYKNEDINRKYQSMDMVDLAKASQRYAQPNLHSDLAILQKRDFANAEWLQAIERLVSDYHSQFERGQAFLVRLGAYGGAESKVLTGTDVAQIKIMQGKNQPPLFKDKTKTIWLAAERNDSTKNLLPMGWALVEVDPTGEATALQTYCQTMHTLLTKKWNFPDIQLLKKELKQEHLRVREQLAEQKRIQTENALQQQAEAAQKAAELAAMTEHQRQSSALIEEIDKIQPLKVSDAGHAILGKIVDLLKQAADPANEWTEAEQFELVDSIRPKLKEKNCYIGKKEKEIKSLLRQLRQEA